MLESGIKMSNGGMCASTGFPTGQDSHHINDVQNFMNWEIQG